MILVFVLGNIEAFDQAVVAARGDDRDFAFERHERFEDTGLAADVAPCGFRIAAVLDRRLAFAVVAVTARLQHRRFADALDRCRQIARRGDRGKRRGTDAEAGDEVFLGKPILRNRQDFRIRQNRNARGKKRRGLRRHVLEFISDDVDIGGKAVERFGVGVIGPRRAIDDIERRRVGRGREHVTLEAEPRCCQRQHAAELAAAENADGRAGFEHGRGGVRRWAHAPSFGASATAAVWFARQVSSRLPSAGSLSANMLAARSAALIAPARPIASVPTGTPGGICTME